MPCKPIDRGRREQIGIDNIRAKVRCVFHACGDTFVVPSQFFALVFFLRKLFPFVKIGDRRDPDHTIDQLAFFVGVHIVVRRADNSGARVA